MRALILIFIIALLAVPPASFARGRAPAEDREDVPERMAYEPRLILLKLYLLVPGQPDLGMKEVEIKLNHFLKDFHITLEEFLARRHADPADSKVQEVIESVEFGRFMSHRTIDVVRDPDGRFQIVDGHHLAFSLLALEIDEFKVTLCEDFWIPLNRRSRRTLARRRKEFREYMVERKLVRLVNENGRPIDWDDLPASPEEMRNNPFRSLAWILKKAGVYEDLDLAMQEFDYAELFLREFRKNHWSRRIDTNHEFLIAARRAIRILSELSEKQKEELPGYNEPPDPKDKPRRYRQYRERVMKDCEQLVTNYRV